MVSEKGSDGLVRSAAALVVSVLLISAIAGWASWHFTVVVVGVTVLSGGSWATQAAIYMVGGFAAAVISYLLAVRLRHATSSFRLVSAAVGNLSVMAVSLPVALIYTGVGPISLAVALAGVAAMPTFWLSLLPMRRETESHASPAEERGLNGRGRSRRSSLPGSAE